MKDARYLCCAVIACAVIVLVSGGCLSVPDSPNPRFYTLEAIGKDQEAPKLDIAADTVIGIGPVRIPEYLNRPQIVTRDKNGMLTFAQFDRWGDPLDLALTRLISGNLAVMLPQASFEIFPWNMAIPVNYQVIADFVQLEAELNKDLFLAVQWSIIDAQENKMMVTKKFELRKTISPHNYSGLVKALSESCVLLSGEIAKTAASLPQAADTKK
ncbi:MAG: PqiC family protein [Candidatus Omnitrophica bacterium]|nr:PqiC family protein [Candidatus Omnitrophota bacterium]